MNLSGRGEGIRSDGLFSFGHKAIFSFTSIYQNLIIDYGFIRFREEYDEQRIGTV